MQKKALLLVLAAVVGLVGWYLFRPERLFVNQSVSESLPGEAATATAAMAVSEPSVVLAGMFHDGAHETKGTATLYQYPNGRRVLRLTGFETSNGPDVQLYLVAANDATDNDTVTKAGFVHLGALKGNIGDQNYDVPADVDLSKHKAVTVWCRRFGVNFGTAPLTTPANS
ncbi:MAG TPA: DM13 domain-containing protein [Candidatus Eisenbacteria bacterium]|nr:DM13 domain-containing protein [Candidatus Eisenbacteria bacterium]